MTVTFKPGKLTGVVAAPLSKSETHRHMTAAALSGDDGYKALSCCEDTDATGAALSTLLVSDDTVNCMSSASTLRFLIPLTAALGVKCTFNGSEQLSKRPLGLPDCLSYIVSGDSLPLKIKNKLKPGAYNADGISSQFASGLLFALPLLDGDSTLDTRLSPSAPYIKMTADIISSYGITLTNRNGIYFIKGNQHYRSCPASIGGDWSASAYFLCGGGGVTGLSDNSPQGDFLICRVLELAGCKPIIGNCLRYDVSNPKYFQVDVTDTPDLFTAIAPFMTFSGGVITGCARLRSKETDRLDAVYRLIASLGGKCSVTGDTMTVFPAKLNGGVFDCGGDHRMVMSAALCSCFSSGEVTVTGAEAVSKSYPDFINDFVNCKG